MSNPSIALSIVGAIVVGTFLAASLGNRNAARTPADYAVGGRSFGAFLLWLLLAGEIYTTFTFLGAAGWIYGKGAPAFYILAYGTLGYIVGFFLLPPIWRVARANDLLTGADFFVVQYGSRALGSLVAIVGFVSLIPYVTLQLTGITTLLRIAGYGTVDATLAAGVAFFAMAIFTCFGGLRGTARASIVKDAFVLVGAIFAGIVLPLHFFGSPAGAVAHVLKLRPEWFVLAGPKAPNGTVWFVSTVVLSAVGFSMFPHSFTATYAAKSPRALRRNAIFLPLYQLAIVLVFFAGMTALVLVPGLKGAEADQSFMLVVGRYYPAWVLGLVAGAGALAGLIPASAQLLGAAGIVAKNLLADNGVMRGERAQIVATRILVLLVAALAFAFWMVARTTLVGLLLLAYNGVTQFFPGVALSFDVRTRPHPLAVACGIATGIAVVAYLTLSGKPVPFALNPGFVALICNVAVLLVVAALTSGGGHRRRALVLVGAVLATRSLKML